MYANQEPIVALATPLGMSAIAILRLSGSNTIEIANQVFKGKDLTKQPSHTVHFGTIQDGNDIIDEVLITLFRAPRSFTKEEGIEISCHGSPFIIEQLMQLFIRRGVRPAEPGEFTKRAFLNGRFDLAQAEAVADLIAADSSVAHQIALQQMRGGVSHQLQKFRDALIHLTALLELELDFGEEELAFADRAAIEKLIDNLLTTLDPLIESFQLGNVLKQGIAVAIIGQPNVGKSTLLNALLQEERAIVSSIAGTTRDNIEGQLHIGGVLFRFIDTAGLRETGTDEIEAIGIERTKQQLAKATIILYVIDLTRTTLVEAEQALQQLAISGKTVIKIGNKMDIASPTILTHFNAYLPIAAQHGQGIDLLKKQLQVIDHPLQKETTIIVNARHHDRLQKSSAALQNVKQGIAQHLPNELLIVEIHHALQALGEITGHITTEEILGEIFSKFCIGK